MKTEQKCYLRLLAMTLAGIVAGCASGPRDLAFPAFINVDELPDVFIAGLPGARSKQLAGDLRTQRSSNRVRLPQDFNFTTGASPQQSVEIFVLAGDVQLGEFVLDEGGYAYIPPGSPGLQMRSGNGATLLYFIDDANAQSVIQTPLITNSNLIDWEAPILDFNGRGLSIKELRADPGSGARSWLLKLDPGATQAWQYSSQTVEGYLLSGSLIEAECVAGEAVTEEYLPGGYFYRPPGAIHGGPESATTEGAVWFLRVMGQESIQTTVGCLAVNE